MLGLTQHKLLLILRSQFRSISKIEIKMQN